MERQVFNDTVRVFQPLSIDMILCGNFNLNMENNIVSTINNDRNAFFTSEKPKKYHAWSCQNVCDALTFLLDNIFIRFGTKLY